jgi:polysaccharide transporter, PST family
MLYLRAKTLSDLAPMLPKLFRHRLVKDTLILFGVQISGYILPLITLPYLTRVLGPANFGLTAIGSAFILYFAVVVDFGFAVTGTRQVAVVQDSPEKASAAYSTIMACKLCLMALCFAALAILLISVPKLRAYWPLYLVSFLQVIGLCLSPNWFLQGMQKMRFIAYSDYGAKIISVLLIFALVHKSSDYVIVAALQSGGFLVSALIGLYLVFSRLPVRIVRPVWSDMREAMIAGWPVFLSLASMIAVSSTNTMILGMMTSPDQVGYLNAAQRLIIACRALTNPVTTAIYPYMSRLASNSRQDGLRFLQKQVLWTAAPFAFVSLGLLLFAPFAVAHLYGPKYTETGVLLQLMSLTPVVHAVSMCFGTYYMLAFGYEKEWSKIITRMMVLNFVLIFALMTVMRPVRAIALTTTLLDLFSAGSCIYFYRRTAFLRAPVQEVPAVG